MAIWLRSLPWLASSIRSRESLVLPETPRKPDFFIENVVHLVRGKIFVLHQE